MYEEKVVVAPRDDGHTIISVVSNDGWSNTNIVVDNKTLIEYAKDTLGLMDEDEAIEYAAEYGADFAESARECMD